MDEHTGAPVETGGTSVVLLMVRDAYANYVVQTALDVVPEGEEKRMLLEELTMHSAQLVSSFLLQTRISSFPGSISPCMYVSFSATIHSRNTL